MNGCSECTTTDDCGGMLACGLSLDLTTLRGARTCVVPESKPDGELCDFEANGNNTCMNYCTPTIIQGVLDLGVCGECTLMSTGCPDGTTCTEAVVSVDGTITPSYCE